MKSIRQILDERVAGGKNPYVSREYQDYGYRLAMELGDPEHKTLYIKLAKEEERKLVEQARSFAIDSKARKKGALFMWKLNQLKAGGKMDKSLR